MHFIRVFHEIVQFYARSRDVSDDAAERPYIYVQKYIYIYIGVCLFFVYERHDVVQQWVPHKSYVNRNEKRRIESEWSVSRERTRATIVVTIAPGV